MEFCQSPEDTVYSQLKRMHAYLTSRQSKGQKINFQKVARVIEFPEST